MLSYRHAFHAGNHADVLKHTVLIQLLRYLGRAGLDVEPFDGCPQAYAAGIVGEWRTAAAICSRPAAKAL